MAPVHSVLKRGVVYGLANNDGSSSIDVPVGTSPAIQAVQTKLLQKVSITPEVLRRDAGTPSALLQRVQVQDSSPIYYTAYRLEGEEPSIAYTQRGIHSDHNGITFLCSQIFAPGHHELDAHFDLPGSGAVGVFPYLQVSVLSEFLSSFSRGGNATSQSTVSFHITTDVEPDGTGTEQISLNGAGDIYVGPLRRIVPWLSSFQSGLHHARVVIDGETTVDEDFIQRGLMFKDPLPTIGTGQPADIPVRTTFGWTNDDTVIDESLPVYLPRWRAALDGSSPTPWRSDNQVDFTINNLRETLTKNIEPLTTSPVRFQSLTKTYQSNKQLDYVVQARAFGLQREYQISGNGSVPGFRRNLILSNFQQTPPQFSNGSQVVFEADINLINFEDAVPDVLLFGLGYDQTTGEYAFQSAGELTPTDYGWHLRVPWTATELPSNGGYLEVAFRENDDYRKSASDYLEFTVSTPVSTSSGTTNTGGTTAGDSSGGDPGNTGGGISGTTDSTGGVGPGTSGSGLTNGTSGGQATEGGTSSGQTGPTTTGPSTTSGPTSTTGPTTTGPTTTSGTAGTTVGTGTTGGNGTLAPLVELFDLVANDFDPTNGGTTALQFGLKTSHRTIDQDVNWDVRILDRNDVEFYHFVAPGLPPGSYTSTGTGIVAGTNITVGPWDGRNEAGQTIDGDFTWQVTANITASVAGPGGGQTAQDRKMYPSKTVKPFVLEVFANVKGQRQRVALYKPADAQMVDLQKYIFPYGRSGQSNTLEFELTGPDPKPPLIAWSLQLHSTVSDGQEQVILKKSGNKFTGQLTVGPKLIKEGDSLLKSGQPVKTTATSCLGYGNIRSTSPYDFLTELTQIHISSRVFPPEIQSLGILDSQLAGKQTKIFKTAALPTADNIACFGFEALDISLIDIPTIATVLKVRHPANEVWLGVHGGSDGSLGTIIDVNVTEPDGTVVQKMGTGPNILPGRQVTSTDTQQIRTLILAACQALDLHDYSNLLHSPDTGLSGRPSPGLLWWNATNRGKSISGGHTVLLGFNRITVSPSFLSYREELARLSKNSSVATGDLEAYAWMNSTYTKAKSGEVLQLAAACAWSSHKSSGNPGDKSGDYYYYIPYVLNENPEVRWRTSDGKVFKLADAEKLRGIYRIHMDDWERSPESWKDIPDFAKPVTIP